VSALKLHLAGGLDLDFTGEDVEIVPAAEAEAVLLVAIDGVPREELDEIRAATAAPVLLLAEYASDVLLDAAEAFGIHDVLPLPQTGSAVAFAARKATRSVRPADEPSLGPARVVTVFSPKGGTGKTVTACNLAAAAAANADRVLLLDLDLQFGDTSIMLGLEPRKTVFDLVSDPGSLDADKLRGYVTRSEIGIDVLPAPLKPEDAERISEDRVAHLIDVARHVYDVIVVDTSPYFHGPMLATLDRSERLVLVAAPDVPTLKNLRLTLHTLELLAFPKERTCVILNRADPRVGLKPGEVGAVLGQAIDFTVPNDPAVPAAVNRAVPVVAARTRCPYAQAFGPLAAELLGEPVQSRRPRVLSLFGRR
jgi:pilus assembly protein CpaE